MTSIAIRTMLLTMLALLTCCALPRALPESPVDLAGLPLPRETDAYPDAGSLAELLTAARVVQAVLANHPDVRAELAALDAAAAERVQSGLLRNPMLSLMTLVPEGSGRIAIEAGWMQSLYDLLTRRRRMELADARWRKERADTVARLLELAWSAQSNWLDAIAAGERLRLLQQDLELDRRSLALQSRLAAGGLVGQAELLRAQAARDERQHMLHEAQAEWIDARSTLAGQLGRASHEGLVLPDALPIPVLPDLDPGLRAAQALAQRAELKSSAAATEIADRERALETGKLARAEPEFGAQLEQAADGMTMLGPAVRFALPVFDDGRALRRRGDALVREAEHRHEAQRRSVLLAVERAIAVLQVASAAARDAALHRDSAQTTDLLHAAQYRDGSIDLLSRFDRQRELIAAKRQLLAAELALAQAHVELQRSLGALLPQP